MESVFLRAHVLCSTLVHGTHAATHEIPKLDPPTLTAEQTRHQFEKQGTQKWNITFCSEEVHVAPKMLSLLCDCLFGFS